MDDFCDDPNKASNGAVKIEILLDNNYDDNEKETQLTDVLTDIRHFCEMKGLDFDACLDSSYAHYLGEKVDNPKHWSTMNGCLNGCPACAKEEM